MPKEKYEPSEDEMKKAEEKMIDLEKKASVARETVMNWNNEKLLQQLFLYQDSYTRHYAKKNEQTEKARLTLDTIRDEALRRMAHYKPKSE